MNISAVMNMSCFFVFDKVKKPSYQGHWFRDSIKTQSNTFYLHEYLPHLPRVWFLKTEDLIHTDMVDGGLENQGFIPDPQ